MEFVVFVNWVMCECEKQKTVFPTEKPRSERCNTQSKRGKAEFSHQFIIIIIIIH